MALLYSHGFYVYIMINKMSYSSNISIYNLPMTYCFSSLFFATIISASRPDWASLRQSGEREG